MCSQLGSGGPVCHGSEAVSRQPGGSAHLVWALTFLVAAKAQRFNILTFFKAWLCFFLEFLSLAG